MKIDIELKSQFEPATEEEKTLFETDLECYKARYRTAKAAFEGLENESIAKLMLRFIELKEHGLANESEYNKALVYLDYILKADKTINGQAFIGLVINDIGKLRRIK